MNNRLIGNYRNIRAYTRNPDTLDAKVLEKKRIRKMGRGRNADEDDTRRAETEGVGEIPVFAAKLNFFYFWQLRLLLQKHDLR